MKVTIELDKPTLDSMRTINRTLTPEKWIEYLVRTTIASKVKAKRKNDWLNTKIDCPFCGGSKFTPFTRPHKDQNCKDCNKDGKVTNSQMVEWGLE